jgi:uncharacterized protein (TIGR00369 family)
MASSPRNPFFDDLPAETGGAWAGWRRLPDGGNFEDMAGPYYFRRDAEGRARCAFRAERRHMSVARTMHGGCLMTLADYAIFVIGFEAMGERSGVTASLNSEFLGAVVEGQFVEAAGEVLKGGASLIFVRGLVTADGDPAMSFSAVIKRVGTRP